MDEKRLKEIEDRAAKEAYSWTEAEKLLQDIPDLLAEVKLLRELLRDIDAEVYIPPSIGIGARIKEALNV